MVFLPELRKHGQSCMSDVKFNALFMEKAEGYPGQTQIVVVVFLLFEKNLT